MSRADVIFDVLALATVAHPEPGLLVEFDAHQRLTALAVVGALAEAERAEASAHVSRIFQDLRAGVPVAGPEPISGVEALTREGGGSEAVDTSALAAPSSWIDAAATYEASMTRFTPLVRAGADGSDREAEPATTSGHSDEDPAATSVKVASAPSVQPRPTGRPATIDHEEVARLYAEAVAAGVNPRTYIAAAMNCTGQAAKMRIHHARTKGLIPPDSAPSSEVEKPVLPQADGQPAVEDVEPMYTAGRWYLVRHDTGQVSDGRWDSADESMAAFDSCQVLWRDDVIGATA